jgi:hypothetical protein
VHNRLYTPRFEVDNDFGYPVATNVLFTGPQGSGLTNVAASPAESTVSANSALYQTAAFPVGAAAGVWIVNYKGTNLALNIPDPQASSRLVVPYPTLDIKSNGILVSWTYRDANTGADLGEVPQFVTQVQISVHASSGDYVSPNLPPNKTNQFAPVMLSPIREDLKWVSLNYKDTLTNTYSTTFFLIPP